MGPSCDSIRNKKQKGVTGFVIVFAFFSIILLIIFAFMAPMLMTMMTAMYAGAEDLFSEMDNITANITDPDVKAELEGISTEAKDSIPTSVSVLGYFFQYSWVIVIVVVLMIMFMLSRTVVETEIR